MPTPNYCQPLDLGRRKKREPEQQRSKTTIVPNNQNETIELLSSFVKVVTVILSKDYRLDIFEAPALHNPFVVSAIFRFWASICASVCPCPELRSMPRI